MKETIMLCDHCLNRDGETCTTCKNNKQRAGREVCIEQMKKAKGIKSSAKLRNIVKASEIVLFKDLCRVMEVAPSIANSITTNDIGKSALEDHESAEEFIGKIKTFLQEDQVQVLIDKGVIDNLDYVYNCAGMVYGSSIHASGTLLSETDIDLPIDAETGDCHCNGHYAEELGYIKYDLLSLSALVPIEEILGINIDWNQAGDDRQVIEHMQSEDLTFVFQFGSATVDRMIQNVPKEALDTISLSEVTSLNRPGPLGIELDKAWANTKNNSMEMQDDINKLFVELKDDGLYKLAD